MKLTPRQAQRAALRLVFAFVGHFVDAGKGGLPDSEPWENYMARQENRNLPDLTAGGLMAFPPLAFVDFEQERN